MSTESLRVDQDSDFMALSLQTRCDVGRVNNAGRSTVSLDMGHRRAWVGDGARLRKRVHPADHGLRAIRTPSATAPTRATSFRSPGLFFWPFTARGSVCNWIRTANGMPHARPVTCASHVRTARAHKELWSNLEHERQGR